MAVAEQKEVNLSRIKEVSINILVYDNSNSVLFTPLEIKLHITTNYNCYIIESYVELCEDYTSRFNRLSGCGHVEVITKNSLDENYTL